jgi:putative flippase GtrA
VALRASGRRFYETFHVLVHEMAKFGIVGAFNYGVDVGLFNLLVLGPLTHQPVAAKAISTAVAATNSYFMNRHWTFRHRASSGTFGEYVVFSILTVIGLGITVGCLAFSEYVLGAHSLLARNIAGNVVGVALATVFRFWSYKRWVFLDPGQRASQTDRDAAEAAVRTTV